MSANSQSTSKSKKLKGFQKFEDGLIRLLTLISGSALVVLMLITCIDVVGRWLFNKPLTGSTELTEVGLAIVVFGALPFVCWRENNIVVDILDSRFSRLITKVRSILIHIISALCLAFLGQRLFVLANRSLSYGEVTEHLAIPLGWSISFMAIFCWLTALALVTIGIFRTIIRS